MCLVECIQVHMRVCSFIVCLCVRVCASAPKYARARACACACARACARLRTYVRVCRRAHGCTRPPERVRARTAVVHGCCTHKLYGVCTHHSARAPNSPCSRRLYTPPRISSLARLHNFPPSGIAPRTPPSPAPSPLPPSPAPLVPRSPHPSVSSDLQHVLRRFSLSRLTPIVRYL